MNQTKKSEIKLIQFFSRYQAEYGNTANGKTELVKAIGAKDWSELTQIPGFIEKYESIKELRAELDSSIDGLTDIEQVQNCLVLLREKWNDGLREQFEILLKWLKHPSQECLFKPWPDSQKNHFDEACQVLFTWKDFFFSYTRRNLPETNNDFKDNIAHALNLAPEEFDKNKNQIHYFAKLIVKYLNLRQLSAFFDLDNMTCGDDIGNKIFNHCKSAFVFTQLIEEVSFCKPPAPECNWCFLEYKEFDEWAKNTVKNYKRHFFILANEPDIVFPHPTIKGYDTWLTKIKALNYIMLIPGLTNLELKKRIIALADEIILTKNSIIKHYLGDFFEA